MPTPEWPIRDEPPGIDLQADPPGYDMPPQTSEASSCNYPIDNNKKNILIIRGEQENLSQSMFTAEAFAEISQHAVLETFDEKRMKQTVVKITEKKHDFHKNIIDASIHFSTILS